MSRGKTWSPMLALMAGLGMPLGCGAEEIEEIIVTEGFRQSELFRSAGSFSVVDQQAAADRNARHLEDTLNLLPNVNFSSGGSRARFLQVRGVGDLEQFLDPKHYPAVGVVVDDIELGNVANSAVLMDIDRIELLRGPQGTRFGSSASAGLVNVRSREPDDNFTARVEAGYANHDSWLLGAVVSGPLHEHLNGRLAVQQYRSDGFNHNSWLDRDNTNGRNELALRGKLQWSGAGPLRVGLAGYFLDLDDGYDAFSLDNSRITQSDQPGQDQQRLGAGAMHAEWDFGNDLMAQAIVTFAGGDSVYAFDEDWVHQGFCAANGCDPLTEYSSADRIARDRAQWSTDLRLLGGDDNLSWVAGVYWQQRGEDLERTRFGTFTSAYDSERLAFYGQLQIPFADRFEAIAGARIERFQDDYGDSNALLIATDDTFWSGELTLKYFQSEQTLWYATLARGVKPGGVNTEASSSYPFMGPTFQAFASARLAFGAEKVLNKEFGVKGHYLDDRLALRLAAFHMDRSQAQLESWIWDAANFLWIGLLDSVKDAENYGAELEFDFGLAERVKLFGGIGYLRTVLDAITVFDLDLNAFVVRQDREQTKAPRWQYHFGVDLHLLDVLDGRIELEGRDEHYFGYYHDARIPAYAVVNASLSYQLDRLRIQLWARNLLDKDYPVHGLYFGNDPRAGYVNHAYLQYGEPRVFGINLSYGF